MDVNQALAARKSIRAFRDAPVSQADVEDILMQASRAPSGGNLQPWQVIAVAGAEKDAISQLALETLMKNPSGEAGDYPIYPANLHEPYRSRRYDIGEQLYEILGIAREEKAGRMQQLAKNFQFFGAPVGLFFIIEKAMGHGQWAHLGMFMQSIMLLATEKGLATCAQEAWAMVRGSLHQHFALPQTHLVYCGLALGYADMDAAINALESPRAPLADFASFRGFSAED